jgi:hypothetical protein
MKKSRISNITSIQRSIAYGLLLCELLTSCGFKETILPSIQPQDPRTSTCAVPLNTSLAASDSTFQLCTTIIEGIKLTFAYTPEAGLQARYQDSTMSQAIPVQQYPVIQDVTGVKKPFSQLPQAESALLATEGKWEINPQGALRYLGMRGIGGGGMISGGYSSASASAVVATVTPSMPAAATVAPSTPAAAASQYDTSPIAIQVEKLTKRRLADPELNLTAEESLLVINHCLRIGRENAENAREKDIVIFLGNTGSGKSTTINYLHGCEMEKVRKKDVGLSGLGKIVRVKASSKKQSFMDIGHTKQSKTFLPEIASDDQLTYCDCPGFLDNRGQEINISNAVNIRNAISAAKSVRVCLLLEFRSLQEKRGEAIETMYKTLKKLFGEEDEEKLKGFMDSVLLAITKVPVPVGGENDPRSLAELHEEFQEKNIFSSHTGNIVTFDPTEENTIEGGLHREKLIRKIESLTYIYNPGAIFKTVLNADDKQKLGEITETLCAKIKDSLLNKNYVALCEHIATLSQINHILDTYVEKVKNTVSEIFSEHLKDVSHAIRIFILKENFVEADTKLASLQSLAEHLGNCEGYASVKELYERSAKDLVSSRQAAETAAPLRAIKRLLGPNYVGEEAWGKLGIVVTDLPPVSDKLLAEAKRLQMQGEQPLLVLDLGKSIAEMEGLCTAKSITVLKADGYDKKLRAETFYEAVDVESRWLLLPGSDHGVLPGSRSKTYADQVKYMESTYPGYAVGGARELVTLAMLKQIQDGTVLFPDEPLTFGRCKEQYQIGDRKGYQICLGGVQHSSSSDFGGLTSYFYNPVLGERMSSVVWSSAMGLAAGLAAGVVGVGAGLAVVVVERAGGMVCFLC